MDSSQREEMIEQLASQISEATATLKAATKTLQKIRDHAKVSNTDSATSKRDVSLRSEDLPMDDEEEEDQKENDVLDDYVNNKLPAIQAAKQVLTKSLDNNENEEVGVESEGDEKNQADADGDKNEQVKVTPEADAAPTKAKRGGRAKKVVYEESDGEQADEVDKKKGRSRKDEAKPAAKSKKASKEKATPVVSEPVDDQDNVKVTSSSGKAKKMAKPKRDPTPLNTNEPKKRRANVKKDKATSDE